MLKLIVAGLIVIAIAAISPITATAADHHKNPGGYTAVNDMLTD